MPETPPPIRDRLRAGLRAATKNRDRVAMAALRSALGAIDNAGAVAPPAPVGTDPGEGPIAGARTGLGAGEADRRELSEADLAAIVTAEVDERLEAAAGYRRDGLADAATRLTDEAAVLRAHLDR